MVASVKYDLVNLIYHGDVGHIVHNLGLAQKIIIRFAIQPKELPSIFCPQVYSREIQDQSIISFWIVETLFQTGTPFNGRPTLESGIWSKKKYVLNIYGSNSHGSFYFQ